MMDVENPLAHPPRPPSEVEWEDLLVRLEIAPRALALAYDDAGGESERAADVLRDAVAGESALNAALEAMVDGRPLASSAGSAASSASTDVIGSTESGASAGSFGSNGSTDSIGSTGSAGSFASIPSMESAESTGSSGFAASTESAGSAGSTGSPESTGSAGSFESAGSAGSTESAALELLERFARLRRRTFAMVQRRGLGVWDWTLRGGPHDGATAYQLLLAAQANDGRVLAALRAGRER